MLLKMNWYQLVQVEFSIAGMGISMPEVLNGFLEGFGRG